MTQPEALRLADKLNSYSLRSGHAWYGHKAADELRRLHVVEKQRDVLLAALKEVYTTCDWHGDDGQEAMMKAQNAIAKAERTTP